MKNRHILALASVLLLASFVLAGDAVISNNYTSDPYLEFRPPFARSLPVQILLTGIVLTLTAVLFIHLMFTAQYHWPLAPVNYVLQLSGVTTLLISLIATIHVVLSASRDESRTWPYMLSYIAVDVPPDIEDNPTEWSIAERATWLVMTASTSGLIQITHIQFLTLLYPSRLEKQLIFALLGPMAIVAAVMQLLPINPDEDVAHVASAVRNVCNATLSLLFTIALFIWGILINRKQAWRTDGGTAVFGCAALSLALTSTALNFIYVHRGEQRIAWLQSLMWAVVLWQSFLGWWWWVGAGSGIGLGGDDDLEEKLRREAKRENRRREAKERRQETKKRAKKVWREVTGAFGREATAIEPVSGQSSQTRRRPPRRTSSGDSPPVSPSRTTSASSTTGTDPPLVPHVIRRIYASVRRAHLIAAQKQTAERVERIREIQRSGISDTSRTTWGVGNLIRTVAPMDQDRVRRYPDTDWEGDNDRSEYEMYDATEWRRNRRSRSRETNEDGDVVDHPTSEEEEVRRSRSISRRSGRRREDESQYRDEDEDRESVHSRTKTSRATTPPSSVIDSDTKPQSLWWWGPLRRWRLRDSTAYS
ncbi:hypothetical protein AGABI1DRAFT_112856 [Agaricus bisporus var. burnettii JB137-S8]|uniref:Uncharacterized protein n=2 Tax=Agaricus bisporus var. burnettii TaxID=192524 RepID=K5X062_AGABU|nr:uncharacterized protein AGABI1DRAFT_112856 [Agaricus bisporus var. burnettii JB137-S8]EKM81166.1 hypothetical protein AGABI1DRAFT_112856 [Agaricus bisporus var. burnettii JB137-S8]KAF7782737.1 hypothetical protein Agabi119p4_2113 [Agaricus bisporus var. burnettii]